MPPLHVAPSARRHRWVMRVAAVLAGAFLLNNVAALPRLDDQDKLFAMPDVTLPPVLADPHAWIIGDRTTGTLWYYHGIAAFPIRNLEPKLRPAFYQFVHGRGEPLYFIYDNEALEPVLKELTEAGARLTRAGTFLEPGKYGTVFKVEW